MSSLHAKFRANLKNAVPSIDSIPSSRKGAAAFLMGGYIKIFVEKLPSQPTLRLSVSVYKIRVQEFDPLELRFMLTSAKRTILTGKPAIREHQIVVIDDISGPILDNYPEFSRRIDLFLDSYWATRSKLIDIKEEYIRRDLKRQKQTKTFLQQNKRFSTSNCKDFAHDSSIHTVSSEDTRQRPKNPPPSRKLTRSASVGTWTPNDKNGRQANNTGTVPKRTSLWKANAFVWPTEEDALNAVRAPKSSSTSIASSTIAQNGPRGESSIRFVSDKMKQEKTFFGKKKTFRCLPFWRQDRRRKGSKLTKSSTLQTMTGSLWKKRSKKNPALPTTNSSRSEPSDSLPDSRKKAHRKRRRGGRSPKRPAASTKQILLISTTSDSQRTMNEYTESTALGQSSSGSRVQRYRMNDKADQSESEQQRTVAQRSSASHWNIELSQLYTRSTSASTVTSPKSYPTRYDHLIRRKSISKRCSSSSNNDNKVMKLQPIVGSKSSSSHNPKVMKLQPIGGADDDSDWWGHFSSPMLSSSTSMSTPSTTSIERKRISVATTTHRARQIKLQ